MEIEYDTRPLFHYQGFKFITNFMIFIRKHMGDLIREKYASRIIIDLETETITLFDATNKESVVIVPDTWFVLDGDKMLALTRDEMQKYLSYNLKDREEWEEAANDVLEQISEGANNGSDS